MKVRDLPIFNKPPKIGNYLKLLKLAKPLYCQNAWIIEDVLFPFRLSAFQPICRLIRYRDAFTP